MSAVLGDEVLPTTTTEPGVRPAPSVPTTGASAAGWDLWLLAATLGLLLFGLVMVVSASSYYAGRVYGTPWGFGVRQLVGVALGMVVGGVVLVMPSGWLERLSTPAWVLSLALLAAVQSPLGHAAKGAPRWLKLGPINVQPSEFAKIALAMMLAHYLARNEGRLKDVAVLLPVAGFLTPMLVLVAMQSDLGSMALLFGITTVALFVAGLEWKWVVGALGTGFAGASLLIAVEPYRLVRLLTFTQPLSDPEGAGYQVVQGWVALAVGGVGGQGLGNGVAQQGFLPEAHTDMIMAIVAEELGIFGWAAVFMMHGVLLWRGSLIAVNARNLYGLVLAASITAVTAAQVVINTGVIGGLLPPKGLVLPFMSYGASAVLFNMLGVAILLRIARDAHRGRQPAAAVEES